MTSLIFQAIDWHVTDYSEFNECDEDLTETKYLIKIFGRNENGNHVSVNVKNYPCYFYIKGIDHLPGIKGNDNIKDRVHNQVVNQIRNYIEEKLPNYLNNSLKSCKITRKKDIWGFTNNKSFKFIYLSFKNYKAMRFVSNLFNNKLTLSSYKNIKFQLYENNIEPYLRFVHKQNLQISGWLEIKDGDYDKTTDFNVKNGENYNVTWKNIKPYECNDIAPFIISSFDIECNSYDGSFPCAIKTYDSFVHGLLDYYNTLHLEPKVNKQEHIYNYIINNINNGKLNYKEKIDLEEIESKFNIAIIDDILSILKGKLQLETENIIKRKQKNRQQTLGNYFDFEEEVDMIDLSSTEIVEKLVEKFDKILPKLNGDPVIQIGTTFHKYGSKECYKKIIVTLDTCSDIEGSKVISCKTEKELIKTWVEIMNNADPDVITGYNILGFDFNYIYHRAIELNCVEYLCNLGKLIEPIRDCEFNDEGYCKTHWIKKTLSSSALGDNFLKYVKTEGRIIIDLMKEVQKNFNLDSYKLDYVAQHFINGQIKNINDLGNKAELFLDNPIGIQKNNYLRLGDNKYYIDDIDYGKNTIIIEKDYDKFIKTDTSKYKKWGLAKDDVSPQEIFKCQKGTADDRARVAKYCIQDCALCNYIIIKLEIIANNIGMSNVCSVPFSYIFLRGQGVKIFSLVAKQCKDDNFLIPYQDKKWKCEKCYFNNSSFDDFCQRKKRINNELVLCCETCKPENEGFEGAIVLDPVPGIYIDKPISVLDYASLYPSSMISENISHDTIVIDEKYDNLPGFTYVDISFDIFKGKGDDKKKIGSQICRYAQFPKNEKGLLPRILQKLLKARKSTRKKITWKTITLKSGDILIGNIIERNDNLIKFNIKDSEIKEIKNEEIESEVNTHNEFQRAVLDGLQSAYKVTANSLYGQVGAPTSPIFMQELAASTTAVGRNLLFAAKKFAEEEYQCEVVYGDSVVGYSPVIVKYNDEIFFEKMEDISSRFGGDKWIPCKEQGKQDKEACELNEVYSWTSKGWTKIHRIIRHQLASHKKIIRVLTHTGCIDVTDDHSLLFKDGRKVSPKNLKIGDELLHKDLDFDLNDKLYKIIFDIVNNNFNGKVSNFKNIQVNSMINALYIYYLGNLFNYIVHITHHETNNDIFYISFYNLDEYDKLSEFRIKPHAIKKMYEINYEGYVYDFTTDNHEFQSGIGEIVASNTDSIFVSLPPLPCYKKYGHPTEKQNILQYNVTVGEQLSEDFQKLLKPPHCLEWEKMFYPFIILSKKRYVGNLYQHDINKFKQKSMGIVLKRRDNANIVKTIYGGIIDIILNEQDIKKSLNFLDDSLQKLAKGAYPLEELIVTKTLRGFYKNPLQIAHKVLADRMKKRDPGNAPESNDRVPYIYIEVKDVIKNNKKQKTLQGDRIEDPKYIVEKNLTPDYGHYITNQIMKPCIQLYGLELEKLSGYKHKNDKKFWKNKKKILMEEKNDTKKVQTKIKQLREKQVEELLFSKYIKKIENKKNGIQSILDFI